MKSKVAKIISKLVDFYFFNIIFQPQKKKNEKAVFLGNRK